MENHYVEGILFHKHKSLILDTKTELIKMQFAAGKSVFLHECLGV